MVQASCISGAVGSEAACAGMGMGCIFTPAVEPIAAADASYSVANADSKVGLWSRVDSDYGVENQVCTRAPRRPPIPYPPSLLLQRSQLEYER
jgi:hypothetical protein